jgi:hypothetical protein
MRFCGESAQLFPSLNCKSPGQDGRGFAFRLKANGYQLRAALLHLRKNDHQGIERQGLDEGKSEDEGELDARAGGRIAR